VVLVADRGPGGQSDGGGFGPPPPPVPFAAPGEGGGLGGGARSTSVTPAVGGGGDDDEENPLRTTACGAREALGEAGAPLDRACAPGSRGFVRETLRGTVETVTGVGGELHLKR
jgi:hypothetical protein